MKFINYLLITSLSLISINTIYATSYNSHGQTGLITLPSAEIHQEQSVYFTFNKSSYSKIGTITVTPFNWMEASYFYYRPDDLLWGSKPGYYLDKGFNVKFSYKPKSIIFPTFAVGLDDFAGTGQFTREYIAATYDFNNIKLTSGMGWGKYVGESSIQNPLRFIDARLNERSQSSDLYELGGNLSYDLWFRGETIIFAGIEAKVPMIKNLSFKMETNPYDYFQYSCCGEGISEKSFELRKKDSKLNFGISYKFKDLGNIDFSYIKGNTWNIAFSIGFSAKKNFRKKNKFQPDIINNSYNQDPKNEFYYDLLENLNRNKLYLQSADLKENSLSISIESSEHNNPIIYTSRAAYISNEVSKSNDIEINSIEVGHLVRGTVINSIEYRSSDLNLSERYPDVLIKKYSKVANPKNKKYQNQEFKPIVPFPLFFNQIAPDIRTHIGSPQRFMYIGYGLKFISEIQLSRNLVINASIGRSIKDNFDKKRSNPDSVLPLVRTEIVDYLQQSSDDFYIPNLNIESVWSPFRNAWIKFNAGYLENMYGGISSEFLYKPFYSNIAIGFEYNSVKKREYDQKFSFLDYEISTSHINTAYYEPRTNILTKLSYGNYLAGDKGFTLDISRRMPSGWSAGFFFTRTNVSAEDFGEGSFDKGFYFRIPLNNFTKGYSKDSNGFSLRTMTRDGGQKLELRSRLIDSFYGSTFDEINENWQNYLD